MSIQERILLRKIKKREKNKLRLIQSREKEINNTKDELEDDSHAVEVKGAKRNADEEVFHKHESRFIQKLRYFLLLILMSNKLQKNRNYVMKINMLKTQT